MWKRRRSEELFPKSAATLRFQEKVTAGKERYRYDSYFLHFPAELLEQAEGTQQATFVLGSRYAPAHAQGTEDVELEEDLRVEGGVVRMARCRLPGGGVAKEARQMVEQRLERFGGKSWIVNRPAQQPNGYECVEWTVAMVCGPVEGGGEICIKKDRFCSKWEYVQSDDPLGDGDGGGGPDNGGGDPDACEYDEGDGTFSGLCFGGGGPGGGNGGGDYNPLQPTEDDTGIAADTLKQFMLPDCSNPSQLTIPWQIKYCRSSLPNTTQESRIADALNRIAQRGQACQKIAQRGFLYLNNGLIRHFPTGQYFYGFGDTGIVMLWEDWIDTYHNGANALSGTVPGTNKTMEQNLDSSLVHEFDHVMGNGGPIDNHVDSKGILTTNEKQCSGLSYNYP